MGPLRPGDRAAAECRTHLLLVVLKIYFYFLNSLLSCSLRELNDQVSLWCSTPPSRKGLIFAYFSCKCV